ncbi:acriflavin resistance protein B [Escherichia coli]|uniref:Acriflavin resistance protein B n=1 Tax=Escherichia coli TaxID=562 RepID=A0A377AZN7_ECOLX|nr:acriflavin resistance protein B [Escherichia coli]
MLLRDVAKIELGGENYDIIAEFNGQPASGWGSSWRPVPNALDTAAAIRAELAKMEPFFPSGLKIVYPYDTTPFVKISIHEVLKRWSKRSSSCSWLCICSCRTSARR